MYAHSSRLPMALARSLSVGDAKYIAEEKHATLPHRNKGENRAG